MAFRAIKITKNFPNYGAQGSALNYLTNLEYHNLLFPEHPPILFEGILRTDQGDVLVTSQDFVIGHPAEEEQICSYFQKRGFREVGDYAYEMRIGKKIVSLMDARPDNVFYDTLFEQIVPIDVQVRIRAAR